MDLFINLLIIIFAIIAFLTLYLVNFQINKKKGKNKFNHNELDLEFGKELGGETIDKQNKDHKKRIDFTESKINPVQEKKLKKDEPKDRYNKTYIRLLARDPNCLYTYWKVDQDKFYHHHPYLRLFIENENKYFDLKINKQTTSWYINSVKANNQYKIAIGYKKEGFFHPLVYSNIVTTPANRPSKIIDEHWLTIEELSKFSYRINLDSVSILKSIEKRKIEEELKTDAFSSIYKK